MTIYKQSIRLNSPRGGYRFNWSRNAGAIPFYFQLAISWTKSTRMRHISEVIAHWRWRVSGEMFSSFIWEENDTIWEKESYCYYWTEISDINFEQIFKMVVRRNHVIQIAHYSLMQILLAKDVFASNSTDVSTNTFLSGDMLTGLLAGFGFFIGLISFICICWCCCCGNGCSNSETDKRRVGPSPPPWRSRPNTRATTANTVSTRITTAPPSRRA